MEHVANKYLNQINIHLYLEVLGNNLPQGFTSNPTPKKSSLSINWEGFFGFSRRSISGSSLVVVISPK